MPSAFTVDPRSGVPLYLQLIEQVKRAVALGALSAGEQLPTVKALALDLTINPNTVARVYRELERDGVIETSPGRGSFVKQNSAAGAQRTADDVAERSLTDALREARSLGLQRGAVETLVTRLLDRWFPPTEHCWESAQPMIIDQRRYEQTLRHSVYRFGPIARSRARFDLRAARPERLGEDDHLQVPARLRSADLRHDADRRRAARACDVRGLVVRAGAQRTLRVDDRRRTYRIAAARLQEI